MGPKKSQRWLFFQDFFVGVKSIVMHISVVIIIFVLSSEHFFGGGDL